MVKVTIRADGIGNHLRGRIPSAVQAVGRAVIASCEPFVPYATGELCHSAVFLPAEEGTGTVVYRASHASLCYYAEREFSRKHHPQACAHWFEAAKAVDLEKWRKIAASAITSQSRG